METRTFKLSQTDIELISQSLRRNIYIIEMITNISDKEKDSEIAKIRALIEHLNK